MSDRDRIKHRVTALRRTRRRQLTLDFFVVGLFWGAIPAGLALLASRILIIPLNEYMLAGALLAAVNLGFVIYSFFVRLTPLSVANDIDLSLGLRERVSSALALAEAGQGGDPFVKTLVKDAAKTVRQLKLKKVYPWSVPRAWKLALPALLIAAALSFVPQLNLFANEQEREQLQLVQDQGHKLTELAEALKKEAEERDEPFLKEQAEEIKRVGEKLESGQLRKKEALKELKRLKEKLESQAQTRINESQRELLRELGAELREHPGTRELGEMLEEGDLQALMSQLGELMQSLEEGQLTPAQQDFLEDLTEALEEALQSQAAQNPEAQELQQAMEDLKQALGNEQQLRDALGKTLNEFAKDLDNLSKQLQDGGMDQQAQQLNQLMQQMQQEFAQSGTVSQQTLEQMQQALEQTQQAIQSNPNLSQQQMSQLSQACKQCQGYFGDQGQLSQQSGQIAEGRQSMAQKLSELSRECSGGG